MIEMNISKTDMSKIAWKKIAGEWYFVTRKIKYLFWGCLSQNEAGLPSNSTYDTLPI